MWKYALLDFLEFPSFNVRTAFGPKSQNKNEPSYEIPVFTVSFSMKVLPRYQRDKWAQQMLRTRKHEFSEKICWNLSFQIIWEWEF